MTSVQVIWHDIECGGYRADLDLWLDLAASEQGPVLDVGAGTGRVTLELARAGHEVVALDREPEFLDELRRRAGTLAVQTVVGDAGGFELPGRRFGLIIAPMQTIQLLGRRGRAGCLKSVREHLAPHGLAACALASDIDPFDGRSVVLPLPDMDVIDGTSYYSQPIALRDVGERMAIERVRTVVTATGERSSCEDVIHLDKVDAAQVEAEALRAGLRPAGRRLIAPTDEHEGTTVVMLRG
jgi:SAM-dependent methyltransferase